MAPIVESGVIKQAAVSTVASLVTLRSVADVMAAFTQKTQSAAAVDSVNNASATGGSEVMFSQRPSAVDLKLIWGGRI